MDCYIFCNMFPDLVSDTVRAPGLRAAQLAHLARPHFDRVIYVMTASRYNLLTRQERASHGVRSHHDFLVLHDLYLSAFLKRIPPAVMVFSQAEYISVYEMALDRHHVVYDVLAPKALELRCGNRSQAEVARAELHHAFCAETAQLVLVNGAKNHARIHADVPDGIPVTEVPFVPIPSARHSVERERNHIMFFSGAHKWTDNIAFLRAMVEVLHARPDIPALFLSALKHHENPESMFISQLAQLPNVRRHASLSYRSYHGLLARCAGALDWSAMNAERENATSTRIIEAVNSGVAVFTNAGTGLEDFWGGVPGETTSAEAPDPEQLIRFIDHARAGAFAGDLTRAADWNAAVLDDTTVFKDIAS